MCTKHGEMGSNKQSTGPIWEKLRIVSFLFRAGVLPAALVSNIVVGEGGT